MGVLGGAFNPPHVGHLVLAQEAAAQLGLERVLLVPVGEAPHRRIEPEPGRELRLEMTRAAAEGGELLRASDLETSRPGPSYTYRTLELLAEREPGPEVWLLMGADVAAALGAWREPRRVLELSQVAVAARTGAELAGALRALDALGGREPAVVEMPALGISSSEIRRRVAEGRPIRHLVPEGVRELIETKGLYR